MDGNFSRKSIVIAIQLAMIVGTIAYVMYNFESPITHMTNTLSNWNSLQ